MKPITEIAGEIVAYVEANDCVTFAELRRRWPDDFGGGAECGERLCFNANPDLIMWDGVSPRANDILNIVLHSCFYDLCSVFAYLTDGAALRLPLVPEHTTAKEILLLTGEHWIPTMIRPLGKRTGKVLHQLERGAELIDKARKEITN